MNPWIHEALAHQHRQEFLAQADRRRSFRRAAHQETSAPSAQAAERASAPILTLQPAGSTAVSSAASAPAGLSRILRGRRAERIIKDEASAATVTTAPAR
jgi:hypothetical protein